VACLFVPITPGSNVLAMNTATRTHSNGDKLFVGCGAKRSPELVFLLGDVENVKIVFWRPKSTHGFLKGFPILSNLSPRQVLRWQKVPNVIIFRLH
jgi:hypothetical protein